MTNTLLQEKRRLQSIIEDNQDDADNGSISAQMQCINAQNDLDRIASSELAEYVAHAPLPNPLILVD
tara:strand:- start:749 stop:949 length:201 start_codon:yes stop_codon:yes gene_type:complete